MAAFCQTSIRLYCPAREGREKEISVLRHRNFSLEHSVVGEVVDGDVLYWAMLFWHFFLVMLITY